MDTEVVRALDQLRESVDALRAALESNGARAPEATDGTLPRELSERLSQLTALEEQDLLEADDAEQKRQALVDRFVDKLTA